MSNESSKTPSGRMNRRTMLGTTTAVLGGVVAGVAGDVFGQDKPKPAATTGSSDIPGAGPNLAPPLVDIKGGKLRGLREGKTSVVPRHPLRGSGAIRAAQASAPWTGVKNAQVWGPVCPSPEQTTVSSDELVFPHRYWVENEHCQYLNVWTQNLTPAAKKPVMVWMHGGGFTNGSSMESYAYDGRSAQRVRRRRGRQHQPPAEYPRHARSLGLRSAVREAPATPARPISSWRSSGCATTSRRFGGDPGNVMIFGQSGGGGKVVRMLHTPDAKGLFHKVAAQSGGNNTYRTTDPAASIKAQQTIAAHTLKNLNLTGDQIDKLKTVPYSALIAAGRRGAANRRAGGRAGPRSTGKSSPTISM